jgi:hypothetical protein
VTPTLSSIPFVSPSLCHPGGDSALGPAYELKFLVSSAEANAVEAWARHRLHPDPHGLDGTYQTTTLYLDTAHLDVYHKSPGYRRCKHRLRRYGDDELLHLERKTRRGDRVRKRRELIGLAELPRLLEADGGGTWFGPRVRVRQLVPGCWLGYARTAFAGTTPGGPVRLTIDRDVVGMPATGWDVPAELAGLALLPSEAILELKFRIALPGLFRGLLETLAARPAGGSKYGRCVEACGLA